jgi:molybdopterin converting factor small subunit
LKVVLKLYASLTDYLPPDNRSSMHEVDVDVGTDATVASIIERFRLPKPLVHLVLVNGVYVEPQQRFTRALSEGDHVAIWPPIAGG